MSNDKIRQKPPGACTHKSKLHILEGHATPYTLILDDPQTILIHFHGQIQIRRLGHPNPINHWECNQLPNISTPINVEPNQMGRTQIPPLRTPDSNWPNIVAVLTLGKQLQPQQNNSPTPFKPINRIPPAIQSNGAINHFSALTVNTQ